jgi:hypothetical protein
MQVRFLMLHTGFETPLFSLSKDSAMSKCFIKIGLLFYGIVAILFCVSSPILSEFLWAYGPEFFKEGNHLKTTVQASWFMCCIVSILSGSLAVGISSEIKCD